MLLSNAEHAIIDLEKLRDYLLSHEHPHGRFKARFFNALGFRSDQWQELESVLRTQHLTQDAEAVPLPATDRNSESALLWSDRRVSPPWS